MENTTETTSTLPAPSKHFQSWLWGLRLSGITTILLLGFLLWCRFAFLFPCDSSSPSGFILPLCILFPCPLVLWWVRNASPTAAEQIKRGLGLAVWWGSFILIIWPLVGKAANLTEESGWVIWIWRSLAVTQGVMVVSAIGTYYSMQREPTDWRVLKEGFYRTIVFVVILCLPYAIPSFSPNRILAHQASAVGNLRTLNTAQITYAAIYEQGYAARLEWLGSHEYGQKPTAGAAGLIDVDLSSGKKSGYQFNLTPGPPDKEGKITSYTLSAQPITYKLTGCRSFFNDETGVIRATDEDRAATVEDPRG